MLSAQKTAALLVVLAATRVVSVGERVEILVQCQKVGFRVEQRRSVAFCSTFAANAGAGRASVAHGGAAQALIMLMMLLLIMLILIVIVLVVAEWSTSCAGGC